MKPTVFASRRGGFLKSLVLGVLFLAAVLVVVWVAFLPMILKSQMTRISGFPVEVESIKANPFGANVRILNFAIHNPAQFATPEFVQLKLLDLEVKPMSLMGDTIEIPRAQLDLEKVVIVTAKDGTVNATLFNERIEKALGEDTGTTDSETPPFHIGELSLRLGRIELIDYSKGEQPVKRTINLNIDRRFTDVTDPKVVITPIVADILRANADALSEMLPAEYQESVRKALKGTPAVEEGARKALDAAKKLFDSLEGGGKP